MTFPRLLLATTALFLVTSISTADDRFVVSIPGNPSISSQVIKKGSLLWIKNGDTVHKYQHTPRLNSPNGRYVGYYCSASDTAIRWPQSDTGRLRKLTNGVWQVTAMKIQLVSTFKQATPVRVVTPAVKIAPRVVTPIVRVAPRVVTPIVKVAPKVVTFRSPSSTRVKVGAVKVRRVSPNKTVIQRRVVRSIRR